MHKYNASKFPGEKKTTAKEIDDAIKLLFTSKTESSRTSTDIHTSAPERTTTPSSNPEKLSYSDARKLLSHKIEAGTLDRTVLDLIYFSDSFLPIEGALLDYKRDIPKNTGEWLKIVKHIQAFHNTYGGYLVFGVAELEKDKNIQPCYSSLPKSDSKKIRDLCREFLSHPIDIQTDCFTVKHSQGDREVLILLIPKRASGEPVTCKKAGIYEGKPIFSSEAAYIRDGDNTCAAQNTHHWKLLYSPRPNPYLAFEKPHGPIKFLENNLPDRDFICQDFIGREDVILKLFNWMSDDFSCVRVLAGEGGLGKTSIAFEFASEVAREHLGNAEIVLWFTAKKYQFRGIDNAYEEISFTSFSNSIELFKAIAEGLGATPNEIAETTDERLPRLLKHLVSTINSFVVIDDLDSLEINEQKRCIEVCQQLSGSGSRFLFTTRKNATASSSTAIEIQGLSINDFRELLKSWEQRLKINSFPDKTVERLHETSKGSPLYTESLLRLIKSGIPVNDAISRWRGNLGVDVRNAALRREVQQLSAEAKRALVTAAVFGECSFAEIKMATEFSDMTLADCMNELQSLFLISAPAIADQPRFNISNTTRDLVLSLGPELIPSFTNFCGKTRSQRYKPKGKKSNSQKIGSAINQAMALITAGNPDEALKTVDFVIAEHGDTHPDLSFMRARALSKLGTSYTMECRKCFKKAHEQGQRKLKFFELWYDVESSTEHHETAIEVCTSAIDASAGDKSQWLFNRAHSRAQSAATQWNREDWGHVRTQLRAASTDLFEALKINRDIEWTPTWKEYLYNVHDSLWNLDRRETGSIPSLVTAFDDQVTAIEHHDVRIDPYLRLVACISDIESTILKNQNEMSSREFNLIGGLIRRSDQLFSQSPANLKTHRDFAIASRDLGALLKNYQS